MIERVYVAGKLDDGAVGYIQNCARMIRTGEEVRKAGFAVFVPCLDILSGMMSGDLDYKDYFDNSQPWLDVCDAVFLVPGWETSRGTAREIKRAQAAGILVFERLDDLVAHRDQAGEPNEKV